MYITMYNFCFVNIDFVNSQPVQVYAIWYIHEVMKQCCLLFNYNICLFVCNLILQEHLHIHENFMNIIFLVTWSHK